ncbi:g11720 [Coccomyxa viridis]|uniref:G11720 protein n=1 Tax=Coccomyxa viridis TaxID=1274662 RepID=A0ABP1GE90_9CHLO
MTLPGNHERDAPATGDRFYPLQSRTDSGGEAGYPYELRLKMPTPTQRSEWYSFNHGPIHFIQTSTEQPFGAGSPQWQFVVNDLQTVDRSVTPWVIVGFHRPIYTPSLEGVTLASDQGVAEDLRNAWETIFFQYEVDMTWSGHVHLYERTCPILYHTCLGYDANGIPNAPVHMAIGNGGYDLTWFINPSPPPYYDALALEHGYTHGTANATTLHITAFSSETGKVIDDFVLKKAANYKPNLTARNNFLGSGFQSTYQGSFLENPGLSPAALFNSVFFNQLAANLKNATNLLQQLKSENASLVVNTNGPPDNVPNLAQVFDVYKTLLQNPGFLTQNGIPNATEAAEFINAAFIPLFNRFDANVAAAAASNGGIDPGIIVPAQTGELAPPPPAPSAPGILIQPVKPLNPFNLGDLIKNILNKPAQNESGFHLFQAKSADGKDEEGNALPGNRQKNQGRVGRH